MVKNLSLKNGEFQKKKNIATLCAIYFSNSLFPQFSAIKFDDILSPETPPSECKFFQQGLKKLTNVGLLIQEKVMRSFLGIIIVEK